VADIPENEILRLAASLERSSEHPLAAAIVAAARERKIVTVDATAFASLTGRASAAMSAVAR
jgi:Cu+-exporting ATPase